MVELSFLIKINVTKAADHNSKTPSGDKNCLVRAPDGISRFRLKLDMLE